MNAIVVLCHFCEQHGPSVVMCTQPYRQSLARSTGSGCGIDQSSDHFSVKRTVSHARLHNMAASGDSWVVDGGSAPPAFASDAGIVHVIAKTSPAASQQLPFPTPPTCRACSFTARDEPGLVSHDQVACTSYVSTQWPKDPDLLNFVLIACQRSLSCEVCPGPDGAFYFGDEVNGHVISYNFQVQDAHSRGLKSQFSFLVLSWDRVFLLNLWPFLVSNLSKMATRIQQAASQVFSTEINNPNMSSSTAIGSGPSTSRHASTVSVGRGTTPPSCLALTGIANITVSGGPSVRHRRAADADMRSLATLTKDDQIFCRIHAWFTWLLRAGARRWTVLPSRTAPPNEDVLIEQEERQAIMVTGGAKPWSISLHSNSKPPMGIVGTGCMDIGKAMGLTGDSQEEETCLALLVLTRLFNTLGVHVFATLAQHIAVGNQLVVQPLEDNLLGCLVIAAVSKLLPRGCLKQIVMSPEYLPPFRCNLLSLSTDAKPSEPDWRPSDGVQIIAVYRDLSVSKNSMEQFVQSIQFRICSTLPSVDPALEHLRSTDRPIELVPPPVLTGSPPLVSTYVNRLVQLLNAQPPLPLQTLDLAISSSRLEWVNRARLLYSFKRCQGPNLAGDEATRRWSSVLSAIGCGTPENANVVLFWQGALSQHSRQNPCHSNRRAPTSAHTSRRTSACSSNVDLTATMAAASLAD